MVCEFFASIYGTSRIETKNSFNDDSSIAVASVTMMRLHDCYVDTEQESMEI